MVLGKFTPKEESMMNMFMPRVKYSVPKFQREYAWNDEKVDAFWDDMLINYEKSKVDPGNPDNQYYLGGMVLLSDPEISEKLILVDGQQRMATITMILCVIRDWLIKLSEDPNSSDELKRISLTNKGKIENFIQTEKSDGSLDDYKLELNERNKNFFRRLVLTPGNPDEKISNHSKIEHASEKNIFSCYESLNKKLSNYLEINPKKEVHPQILLEFSNLLLEWITIISITVKKEEDAFDIFETLNQRGQTLAIGDLIKNNLLKNTSSTKRDHVDNNWGDMMSNLDQSENVDQFLRYSWFSRNFFNNGKLIKNNLFKEIKKIVNDEKKVEKYVDELLEDSEIFQAIINSSKNSAFWNDDKDIIRNLSALRDLDALYVIPTIITAYRMYKTEYSNLKEIIRLILVYFFRFKIIGPGHGNDVETIMVKLCQNLSGYDDETEKVRTYSIDEIKTKLTSRTVDDTIFEKQFSDASIKKTAYVKYILKEIEQVLAGSRTEELETNDKLTVEHVLPKSFKNWQSFFDEKKITNPETLVYRLGNLTILTKKMNSTIRDSVFDIKKTKAFDESHLELNKQTICGKSEWTDKIIYDRQENFAKIALKIWKF